ncbi:MAG TPA: dTMP kinase [Acidimicrobiales bacterium]|nr:dTMP kinase [Acidimicrobiales bacterium]
MNGGGERGRFIAFEGGEASGKSTQARLLAARIGAVLTREPGATETGRRIRDLVLDPATELHPRTEALLLLADRAQHVHEVVAPALARGADVVTDRFSGSTLAYQGYGRGLDLADLSGLSRWATGAVEPDLIVLLDVPGKVARDRQEGRPLDRMEGTGDPFHERVREGYLALAAADPDRWVVVDGSGPEDEVAAEVWAAVSARAELRHPPPGVAS